MGRALAALVLAGGALGAAAAGAAAGPLPPAGPAADAAVPGAVAAFPAPAGRPERVVSINGCTDQLALLLAAPGQLVSVSHVAHDPVASVMWREARAYPANRAQAEEIHLLAPDLVLAGTHDNPATLAMLERLGLRVERFGLETALADIAANLDRMAALLGVPERAAPFLEALAALPPPDPAAPRPRAVLHYPNGFTSGAGSLAHAVLEAAGLANVAAEAGVRGMARLPLEMLVLAAPDLIVTGEGYRAPALAQEVLRHPAARSLEGTRRVVLPAALTTCGTPQVVEAIGLLREAAGLAAGR